MNKKFTIILTALINILVLITPRVYSQQPIGNFKMFFEKVYLQTDREYYTAGEDIWYKAYLVNAISNNPTSTSGNLYVEIIASDATILNKQIISLTDGKGNGDFRLSDTLSEGTYKIRAYTNWMRNFGSNFLFEKIIKVGRFNNTPASKSNNKNTVTNNKNTKSVTVSSATENRLQFFPEGGSIIAGINNIIAFKAEDANGKGISCEGTIINSKGKAVASFKSSYLGMGSFSFTAEPDENYDVKATCNGKTINADLPIAMEKGFVLSVTTSIDSSVLLATIKTNKTTLTSHPSTLFTIGGRHAGKTYFQDSIRLTSTEATIKIPKNVFPQGIAVLTLYDEKLRPNSERLVYIEKETTVTLSAQISKNIFSTDERTAVNINVTNNTGTPIKSNLSMAVVDAGVVPVSSTNIVNYLLLQSELKGNIENADNYFNEKNPNRLQQLDLLLLTQGWREFVWTKLAQEGIKIKYLPEPGITISGSVKRTFSDKPLKDMNITLFAPQAKGDKLLFTKTDSAGKYYIDGVKLFGTQTIKLVSKDGKGNKGGVITMDTLFKNTLPASAFTTIADTTIAFQTFQQKAAERLTAMNKIKDDELKELPGVTVTAKDNKNIITSDDILTKFGYRDSVFTPTAADMKDYGTLENYIHHKMPGAQDDIENSSIFFYGDRGTKIYPRFFVDNREDRFDRVDYYQLTMDVISKVVITHTISAMTGQHVYQIHLSLKPGALDKTELEVISTEVTGYYEARNFYLPQPKTGEALTNFITTLDWVPNIEITANGGTRVVIDNKKIKSTYRIVIEGLTETGIPLFTMLNYEVK